jgi:hypothetical protein
LIFEHPLLRGGREEGGGFKNEGRQARVEVQPVKQEASPGYYTRLKTERRRKRKGKVMKDPYRKEAIETAEMASRVGNYM